MINLFTSYYLDKNPIRQAEINHCLTENLCNPSFDMVYILTMEEIEIENSDNHKIIKMGYRETFEDYFKIINKVSGPNDINIISNSDIVFNGTIKQSNRIQENECYALTRWEGGRHYGKSASQDVWIFQGKVRAIESNFYLGKPGCDNRIAYEIKKAGYTLKNPSFEIVCNHVHKSGIRNYDRTKDRVPGPYITKIPFSKITRQKTIFHISLGTDQKALTKALSTIGNYTFLDWTAIRKKGPRYIGQKIREVIEDKDPDYIFMQIQTPDIIQADTFKGISAKVINWTGDVRKPTPNWYFEVGKRIDMTLFSNEDDVQQLLKEGIPASFLNIGFDDTIFKPEGPKEEGGIVFMGNHYNKRFPLSDLRYKMVHALREEFKDQFQVYGGGWDFKTVNLMGNQEREAAVYRGSKMAINCSHFDLKRYSSDRIFRLMGSGAFCLSHKYNGIEKDFKIGEDLVVWDTVDNLISTIKISLPAIEERKWIASNGCAKVHKLHTWSKRIEELKYIYESI